MCDYPTKTQQSLSINYSNSFSNKFGTFLDYNKHKGKFRYHFSQHSRDNYSDLLIKFSDKINLDIKIQYKIGLFILNADKCNSPLLID